MKEIDGGAGGRGGEYKGREEVDLHKRERDARYRRNPFPFSSLWANTPGCKKKKKKEIRPARSKNKSLHFLDVLVALTFACAVSPLTNVTTAHPSAVISFAEGVLVPRNRRE